MPYTTSAGGGPAGKRRYLTTFPRAPCAFPRIDASVCVFARKAGIPQCKEFSNTAEVFHCWEDRACAGDFCGNSGGIMWARLLVGVGGSGLGLRASRGGSLRVAGAGCAGKRQQQQQQRGQASSAEVRGPRRDAGCKRVLLRVALAALRVLAFLRFPVYNNIMVEFIRLEGGEINSKIIIKAIYLWQPLVQSVAPRYSGCRSIHPSPPMLII